MHWLIVPGVYCLIATGFYTYLAMTAQDEPSESESDQGIAGAADWARLPDIRTKKVA